MIKRINLKNFRNHEKITLEFNNNFVYINGPNGSGKTSILESIYYTSMTKSHRTNNDLELIQDNMPFSVIKIETDLKKYQMVISEKGKIASIDNKEIKKLSNYIGDLKVVMFAPEDLNIIKGSPSIRRNFIDFELIKIHKQYLKILGTYRNILKQRNTLLKDLQLTDDLTILNILGKQLYEEGIKLISIRRLFLNKLNVKTKHVYKKFSDHEIEVIYEPNVNEEQFLKHLENHIVILI